MALQLDPNDAHDARIIALQVKAAREAGASGDDRAATTRGRPDLEAAFDEGAAAAAGKGTGKGGGGPAPEQRSGAASKARAGWKQASNATHKGVFGGTAPKPTLQIPSTWSRHNTAGFALGLILYAPFIAYIRYGAGGPTGWFAAKFLNRPIAVPKSGAGTVAASGGTTASDGGTLQA